MLRKDGGCVFRRAIVAVMFPMLTLVSGPAVATTMSVTVEPYIGTLGPLDEHRHGTITPFDASLGTLTRVDWQVTTQTRTLLTAENISDQTVTRNVAAILAVNLRAPFFAGSVFGINDVVNTSLQDYEPGQVRQFDLTAGRELSRSIVTDLSRWTTTDPEPFTTFAYAGAEIINVTGGVPAGVLDVESDTSLQLSFSVTYHYEPTPVAVIPLPATGGLLLTALFGLGVYRYRKM